MDCVKVDLKNNKTLLVREEVPKMENETDVIVKIAFAGICGTDIHIIQGEFAAADGVTLGHEMSGTIVNVSPKYSHLAVGDRVVVNPNICCGICEECKKELYNFCVEGGLNHTIGIFNHGAWAKYCKAHVSQIEKLPAGISFEQGVLCEPMSCIVHGLDELPNIPIGSNILVIGAGIIGLLWSCTLHLLGHKRVYVAEPNETRLERLKNLDLGFQLLSPEALLKYHNENPNWKADFCIDCSGNAKAMQGVIPLLANRSTFLMFGVSAPEHTITVHPYELFRKEITIKGVCIDTPSSYKTAVAFIDSMKDRYLKIEKLGIKKFPLKDHENALKVFLTGAFNKIMFEI